MLEGKTALVTGGSSGNGRAICMRFAELGATVVVADVTEEPREGGKPTAEAINEERPGRAHHVACDVGRVADLEAAVGFAEGRGGLDVLVNNAGILKKEPLLEATEETFARMVEVNVKSVLFASKAAAEAMAPRGEGAIVNIGSIAGIRGTGGYCHYNLSKGAVRMLTCSLADELGPKGIRVNAVAPGIMHTQMNVEDDPVIGTEEGEGYLGLIPARRWGKPGEVADACAYLASDMAKYVMGATLVVDGGYLRI